MNLKKIAFKFLLKAVTREVTLFVGNKTDDELKASLIALANKVPKEKLRAWVDLAIEWLGTKSKEADEEGK